jgi:hypothetical protein
MGSVVSHVIVDFLRSTERPMGFIATASWELPTVLMFMMSILKRVVAWRHSLKRFAQHRVSLRFPRELP